MDNEIHHDEWGHPYILDENGNRLSPPITDKIVSAPRDFTIYDTSQERCPLCGRLGCGRSVF